MSIRARLLWLVLALALPLAIVGTAGLYLTYRSELRSTETLLGNTARALAVGIDREVGQADVTLRILAGSTFLESGDLASFHSRAVQALGSTNQWVGLFSPEGQLLLSTLRPFGSPLPPSAQSETFRRIALNRKPEVTGLFRGSISGQAQVALGLPVVRDGAVRYVLGIGLGANVFQALVRDLQLPGTSVATILDRNGFVIARSREAERSVGQIAPDDFITLMTSGSQGTGFMEGLDGQRLLVAHSLSPEYGLRAAVGYPEAELDAALRQSVFWAAALLAIGGLGFAFAAWLAQGIAKPLTTLGSLADGLAAGTVGHLPGSGLSEVDRVQEALMAASRSRLEAERRVRDSELRLRLAMEAGQLGAWEYDLATGTLVATSSCKAKFGRGADEPFTYDDLIASIHPDDREGQKAAVEGAISSRQIFETEYRAIWPDGSLHWVQIRGGTAEQDGVVRLVGVSQDVTGRMQAETRQQLLVHELNHRVKNTLATVQSIAAMTARSSSDPAQAWETFEARIHGMAKTHNLLTQSQWEGAPLEDILTAELDPYQDMHKQRVLLHGKSVMLGPRAALAIGLATHELATNAAKYGALSNDRGRLAVRWTIVRIGGLPHILVEWAETGGPAVTKPSREGFGSRLIRSLARELAGEIKLNYEPIGLRCVLTFPLMDDAESVELRTLQPELATASA
ncbi:MAG TPA: HWE histidine kinase domain-containing protein [Microvirga sp.]|jgi:PAS domain S-box-containing protein